MASMRERFEDRAYPLFAWAYTTVWSAAVVYVWVNAEMPLWSRLITGAVLTITTPAGRDLLLIRRLWRSQEKPKDNNV